MGTGHDGLPASKPFRWARLIEGSRLGVQLHVSRVNTRAEHPWVVEVVLAGLDEKNLEVMVKVGQAATVN
jgi:hypothetical protein